MRTRPTGACDSLWQGVRGATENSLFMFTLDDWQAIQTPDGQRLLQDLRTEPLTETTLLGLIDRYRRHYPPALVRAAVEQAHLRQRAREKFARAEELYFTRDGLEMASAEPVARHTAARFAGLARVWDLCCGIGGDALALARVAEEVIAVDREPLAVALLAANAEALGVAARVTGVPAAVEEYVAAHSAEAPAAIFCDPSRRESARAARRPEAYAPPLAWCLALTAVTPRVAIKVSPALDYEPLLAAGAVEAEVISWRGECRELLLWLGAFRTCTRRATNVSAGVTLTDEGPASDALGAVGAWLFEPDPAAVRAHLVQRLAGEFALRRIDPEIAYLTGDVPVATPWLAAYPVRAVLPWNLKRLNAALRAGGIGRVTIKKRGFPLTPEALRPRLALSGTASATLICTRVAGELVVIFAGEGERYLPPAG
jgi:hypothetical protein